VTRGKIFFFADYQATRTTQGIETGNISVPSLAERAGDFSSFADRLTGHVNGSYWASLLAQKLGTACRRASRTTRRVHDDGAVRVSQRADSAARVVDAGAAAAAVRAVAHCRDEHSVDRRVLETVSRR